MTMTARTTICILALTVAPVAAAAYFQKGDLQSKFEELDTKNDRAGIVALFRQNPYDTLGMLDGYLEGALAKIEKGGDPADIEKDHERALRGARAADEALGHPVFLDYVSSYVGWNRDQQKVFREGQAASGASRQALQKGDFETAKKEANRCIECARPLGDWWGYGTGLQMLAQAEEKLGHREAALDAIQQARILHHDLGFARQEYRDVVVMARLLVDLGRTPRARAAIEQGLALSRIAKDKDGPKALEDLLKKLDDSKGNNR